VVVNDEVHGQMTAEKTNLLLDEIQAMEKGNVPGRN
jgi:NADH:ubiquinone oxidoreductase subunit E